MKIFFNKNNFIFLKKIFPITHYFTLERKLITHENVSLNTGKDLDLEIKSFNDNEILSEYNVGLYRVKLVKNSEEYRYIAEYNPAFKDKIEKIYNEIDKLINYFIMRLPDKRVIDEINARKIIREYFGKNDQDIDLVYNILKEELGYKKLQVLIDDPYVEDVSISGPGYVWIRHSYIYSMDPNIDLVKTNIYIRDNEELIRLQQIIANKVGRAVSYTNPILDIQLPLEEGGHRIHITGQAVSYERPEIVIRKNIMRKVSVEDLIRREMLPRNLAEYFRKLIMRKGSLIIAGPPGSGKTTLLRALLNSFVPKDWKVVIIEDTPEIEIPPDSSWVRYTTFENGVIKIDQYMLTKAALRSSANRLIVIGETRGSEARVLAQALNMGLGALTTFHGGSTKEVIVRLMSPPISLRIYQISTIQAVAVLAIHNNRRIVRYVDEIIPTQKPGSIKIRRIYDRDKDPYGEKIFVKSYYENKDFMKRSIEIITSKQD